MSERKPIKYAMLLSKRVLHSVPSPSFSFSLSLLSSSRLFSLPLFVSPSFSCLSTSLFSSSHTRKASEKASVPSALIGHVGGTAVLPMALDRKPIRNPDEALSFSQDCIDVANRRTRAAPGCTKPKRKLGQFVVQRRTKTQSP